MNTKPTNTLFRLFFSIAITVGLVLVYAKPLPNNYDQAGGGYLIEQQQQQQPPNAGEGEFVVAYGGDDIPTNYNLDNIPNPDELLNTDPSSFSAFSNPPTPTIQENPTFTTTEKSGQVALEWIDNLMNNIREKFGGDTELSPPPPPLPTPTLKEKFQNFPCSGSRSICCSGNMNKAGISGKHTCANSKFSTTAPQLFFSSPFPPPLF